MMSHATMPKSTGINSFKVLFLLLPSLFLLPFLPPPLLPLPFFILSFYLIFRGKTNRKSSKSVGFAHTVESQDTMETGRHRSHHFMVQALVTHVSLAWFWLVYGETTHSYPSLEMPRAICMML